MHGYPSDSGTHVSPYLDIKNTYIYIFRIFIYAPAFEPPPKGHGSYINLHSLARFTTSCFWIVFAARGWTKFFQRVQAWHAWPMAAENKNADAHHCKRPVWQPLQLWNLEPSNVEHSNHSKIYWRLVLSFSMLYWFVVRVELLFIQDVRPQKNQSTANKKCQTQVSMQQQSLLPGKRLCSKLLPGPYWPTSPQVSLKFAVLNKYFEPTKTFAQNFYFSVSTFLSESLLQSRTFFCRNPLLNPVRKQLTNQPTNAPTNQLTNQPTWLPD